MKEHKSIWIVVIAVIVAAAVALSSLMLGSGKWTGFYQKGASKTQVSKGLEKKLEWQLKDLYTDEKAWMADYIRLKNEVDAFEKHEGHLGDSAQVLRLALDQKDQIDKRYDRLYAYAMLRRDGNFEDPVAKSLWSSITGYTSEKGEKSSYFYPELYQMSKSKLMHLADKVQLKPYYTRLMSIASDNYSPDAKVEYIKSLAGNLMGLPEKFYQSYMYEYTDSQNLAGNGDEENRTSDNREKRKEAFDMGDQKLENGMPILSAAMAAKVETNKFQAKSRGYDDIVMAFLDDDGLDLEMYNMLMQEADGSKPLLHRFMAFRKNALGISDKLRYYDGDLKIAPPYGAVPFKKAVALTEKAIQPFGKTYSGVFEKAVHENWMDVYPRDNKYTGSYTYSAYTGHPYMLLNYQDDLASAATLAHETGHAVNQYLTNKSRNYQDAEIPMIHAEIASTVNEILFYDQLLEEAKTDQEKSTILESYLMNLNSGFYYQAALAKFQETLHRDILKGQSMETSYFNKTFGKILGSYYGPEYEINLYDQVGWAQVDHLYWDFYVYKYVMCTAASVDIAKRIESGDTALLNQYLLFLEEGDSESVEASFEKLGIDLRRPDYVQSFKSRYAELLDQLIALESKK